MKKWILLVEDDTDLVDAISSYLNKHNYYVISARTVKEALMKLKKQSFFCVITDIRLSDGSGEDVINYTRMKLPDSLSINVPIIVVSGFLDKALVARIGQNIFGAFVKPFDMKSLVEKLSTIKSSGAQSA